MIEKNQTSYEVCECKNQWSLRRNVGKLTVDLRVSKSLCATFEELLLYVQENPIF